MSEMVICVLTSLPLLMLAVYGAWQAGARPALVIGLSAAAVLLALMAWHPVPPGLWPSLLGIVVVWGSACAVDVTEKRLPDLLTLGGFAALAISLLGSLATSVSFSTVGPALLAGLLSGALFLLIGIVSPARFGLGDVKLALSTGTVLGCFGWYPVLVGHGLAFVLAGVGGLVLAAVLNRLKGVEVPFGPFMVLGALVAPVAAGALT